MKKRTKIITLVGTISAGILGLLGYTMLLVRNTALYGVPELYGVPNITQDDIQYFNSQFIDYLGHQRGSTVRALIQTVQANNATREDCPITVTVLTEEFDAESIEQAINKIKTSKSYNVEPKYSKSGRVCEVIVTEVGV